MNEAQRPPSAKGTSRRPTQSWDVGAISIALDHQPEATRDVVHGPGLRYDLADGRLTAEIFPPHAERRTGIVRLGTEDSRQEFYRQPQPAIREECVVFETSELLIRLSSTSALATFRLVPDERPVVPPDAPENDDRPNARDDGAAGSSGDSAAPEGVSRTVPPETRPQPRVAYRGRLGTDPRTKTTPKGKFVMEFPVAVAVEGRDKPEWRDTVVFDAKARALEGVLARGSRVAVVAYEHARRHADAKTGATRETKEYYATSVTPETAARPADDDPGAEQRR